MSRDDLDRAPIKLLILSAGSLVAENIVDSLAGRRDEVRIIGTNSIAESHNLYRCDRSYLVPNTDAASADWRRQLAAIVDEEEPDLVIPCRDADVLALAQWTESLGPDGPKALVGTPAAAEAICDKWRSHEFSVAHGLPFAQTALASEPDALRRLVASHGFPLICKPRRGFASRGVRIIWNEGQLASHAGDADTLVQQYLSEPNILVDWRQQLESHGAPLFFTFEEPKYSLQLLIGPNGDLVDAICTRHLMRQGKSAEVERHQSTEADELIHSLAAAFSSQGWRGPLNAQCQLATNGRLHIYEFNGRFTGATAARTLLNHDELGLAIGSFCNRPIKTRPVAADVQAVLRAQHSVSIALQDRLRLTQQRRWTRGQ